MEYEYRSENVPGNLHDLAKKLNRGGVLHGWELVAAQSNGGHYTVAILRRTAVSNVVSLADAAALRWAAERADEWYGSVTGDREAERAHIETMDGVQAALAKMGIAIKRRDY